MRRPAKRERVDHVLRTIAVEPYPNRIEETGRQAMTRHLIIGGGPAAINAIETIRDVDQGTHPITLVSDEPAYARMVLPYYLAGQIPQEQVFIADDAFYDSLKVNRQI